jgi:hypothetical protein
MKHILVNDVAKATKQVEEMHDFGCKARKTANQLQKEYSKVKASPDTQVSTHP